MASLACVVHYNELKLKSKVMPLDHHKFKILNDNKRSWQRTDSVEALDHELQCDSLPEVFDVQKHGAHRECYRKFTAKRKSHIPVKDQSNVRRSHSYINPREHTKAAYGDTPHLEDGEVAAFGLHEKKKAPRRVIRDMAPSTEMPNESKGSENRNGFRGQVVRNESGASDTSYRSWAEHQASRHDELKLSSKMGGSVQTNGHTFQSPTSRNCMEDIESKIVMDAVPQLDEDEYIVVDEKGSTNKEFTVSYAKECKDHEAKQKRNEDPSLNEEMARFRKDIGFQMHLQGSVNGESFLIEGKGIGISSSGLVRGRWECTTGILPISWAALSSTLAYSFKCFTFIPNGISHFLQECMPQGYTQEQFTTFQDGGIIRSFHEVNFQNGMIINHVTLKGDGFKPNSLFLSNGIKCFLPCTETTFPFDNGMKSLTHHVYPTRSGEQDHIIATQVTINLPIGKENKFSVPTPYFSRAQIRQTQCVDDEKDHIIQEQILEGYDFNLVD